MLNDELRLRLINCGPLHVTPDEVRRMTRHPYFIALFSLFVLPGLLVSLNAPSVAQGTIIALQGVVLSVLITAAIVGMIRLWARWTRDIHLSVIIGVAVLLGCLLDEAMKPLSGREFVSSPAVFLANTLVILFLGEVGATFSFLFVARPILRDLRAGRDGGAPVATAPRAVTVGARSVDAAAVISAMAEGNYVDVRTLHGRLFEKATLSSLTAQFSENEGILVSRSCWIARESVVGQDRRDGRLILTLRDGREVKVARTRQAEVQAWLLAQDLAEARARAA